MFIIRKVICTCSFVWYVFHIRIFCKQFSRWKNVLDTRCLSPARLSDRCGIQLSHVSYVLKGTLDVKYTIVAQNDVPELFSGLPSASVDSWCECLWFSFVHMLEPVHSRRVWLSNCCIRLSVLSNPKFVLGRSDFVFSVRLRRC